jgi:MscS family membrane protein
MIDDQFIQRLPHWLRGDILGVEYWQYLALLLILLFGLMLRKVIQFIAVNRLKRLVEDLGQTGAAHLVDVVASPGATLIVAVVLRVAYPKLRLPVEAEHVLAVCVRILVVLSLVWAAYRLVDVLADRLAQKASKTESKLDDQLVPLLRKLLKVFVVISGILAVLQNLDVNIASLLAGLGIGGVAVALAAKDTIANFFGGIMIFADRPFQIGDWIAVSGIEGVVEEVGFRSTRIRTFYNSLVTVPNAKFTEANIDNYGQRQYRRTFVTLNLTYDTRPEQIQAFVEGIRAILQANPNTRKDYYEVHFSAFGAHSLDVMVYFFFKVPSWSAELRERHNVYLEILRLAHELGVTFAFPTQTVHVESLAMAAERPKADPPGLAALAGVVEAFGPGGQKAQPATPCVTEGYFAGVEPKQRTAAAS